jgi:acetylornithine deacetylase
MDKLINELQIDRASQAIALLKKLIATPSFSAEESLAAAVIEKFFSDRNICSERVKNNVWASNRHFDPGKKSILLNTHIDTVKPNKDYTNDPFRADEKDGKLYGLGSNDAGGCLVALAQAFLYFYEQKGLKYNLIFAASAEEEISGVNGISVLLPMLGDIEFALVGEPTLMQMAVAEKGLLVLDCIAAGTSGHAARQEGINAIYTALPDIEWFRNYSFPLVSPFLGPVHMNVTMINAGTQHNVIPAACTFTVDIRINDCYTHEEILEVVRTHVVCEVKARSLRLRSTGISQDHPIVKAGFNLNLRAFGSATLSDKALMPFPALKIGPGDSARSHIANEFIFIEEIKQGIEIYIQLLKVVL